MAASKRQRVASGKDLASGEDDPVRGTTQVIEMHNQVIEMHDPGDKEMHEQHDTRV